MLFLLLLNLECEISALTLYEKYIKNKILTQSTLIETYSTNYSRATLKIASRLFYPTQFSKPLGLKRLKKKNGSKQRQRMQIEENFRNTKNSKRGISLEYANSKSPERYDNLLLVAAMILFVLWCLGYASSQLGQAKLLQANTEKKRNVLSLIYTRR